MEAAPDSLETLDYELDAEVFAHGLDVPWAIAFIGARGALPSLFTYGHRNPQGLGRVRDVAPLRSTRETPARSSSWRTISRKGTTSPLVWSVRTSTRPDSSDVRACWDCPSVAAVGWRLACTLASRARWFRKLGGLRKVCR